MGRVRRNKGVAAAAATVVAASVLAATGISIADNQFVDGDSAANTPNLAYGSGHRDCATLGQAVAGAVRLKYTGNQNDASQHFTPGAAVNLDFAPDAAAQAAGITNAPGATATIPGNWGPSSTDLPVPFTTTVPAGIADGTYKVGVAASTGAYAPGRPLYVINVACHEVDGNVAPTVSEIAGDSPVDEGTSHSYAVTAGDADHDTLTYAWSITSGNASFNGASDGASVSVNFPDGPDTVGLQVDVNDGHGHLVTKTTSVTVNDVAPTATIIAGDTNVNESTATHTYTYTVSDPGVDTQSVATSCGTLGTKSNATGTDAGGSFDCTFLDGLNPATTSDVTVQATDSDGVAGNTATQPVTVNNVAPTVGALTLGGNTGTACLSGKTVTVDFGFTDPGTIDNPWAVSLGWGDGSAATTYNTATQGTQPQASHLYIGAGTWTIGASVTDKDNQSGSSSSGAGAVALLYSTGQGILQPINYTGPRSLFKLGSTIPVKLKIVDCNGTAVGTLRPQVALTKVDSQTDPSGTDETPVSTVPDQGTTMRFTGSPDNQYIYNLATKPLTVGTYRITVTDPTIANVVAYVDLKK